jgi:hypothetical protein
MKLKIETDMLPEATAVQIPGTNGLFRLNYFNGRYLTAEALRKEQIYWDYRARLDAEIHPSGIAWGLGLETKAVWAAPPNECSSDHYAAKNGVEAKTVVTLQPGLAFNGAGRPITVGAPFEFRFADLLDQFKTNRTIVVDGGTQFAPCVCLAPGLPGPSGGGSVSPGPYLLLLGAVETNEGEAKVYGNVCGSAPPKRCEADGWRGGFALSLARFPVDVPLDEICSAWDLRGVLSAYYFDVYEHALLERWLQPFPRGEGDVDFCAGLGPFDRQDGAVPLAMVYVGSDGSILFMDPWIPRRPIAATASAAWAANLRGAPTQAACLARVHQFQCQLDESLTAAPQTNKDALNLHERGFRHIPPWGFLPGPASITHREPSDNPLGAFQADRVDVLRAETAARTYFQGTNVLTYAVVAIHDDDILEDMIRAMEKDPVELRPCGGNARTPFFDSTKESNSTVKSPQSAAGLALLRVIAEALGRCGGITMHRLINREIEIVKLMIPMRGLRRAAPIVGAVGYDGSAGKLGVWGRLDKNKSKARGGAYASAVEAFLQAVIGPAAQPHEFVFYVKQRLVLLDVVYLLLDAVLELFALLRAPQAAPTPSTAPAASSTAEPKLYRVGSSFLPLRQRDPDAGFVDTTTAREMARVMPSKLGDYASGLLADDVVRYSTVAVLRAWAPELTQPSLWTAYDAERARLGATLVEQGTAPDQAAALARDRAVDLLLREHAGFGVLKLAAIALPEADSAAFEGLLRDEAKAAAPAAKATVADATFYANTYEPFEGARAEALFDAARVAYGEQPVTAVGTRVAAAPGLAVNDVLKAAPSEVSRLVGSAHAGELVSRVHAQGREMIELVNALGASPRFAEPAFWKTFDAMAANHPGKISAALRELESHGAEADRKIGKQLEKLHTILGDQGLVRFLAKARGPAGGASL